MGVMKAGTHGSFGDAKHDTDFGMAQSPDIVEDDDFTVFIGQFKKGFTDFILQFGHLKYFLRIGAVGVVRHGHVLLFVGTVLIVIQTVHGTFVPFFQEIPRMVQCDGMQPCVEGALSVEVAEGTIGLGKSFLGNIVGIVVTVRHLIEDGVQLCLLTSSS